MVRSLAPIPPAHFAVGVSLYYDKNNFRCPALDFLHVVRTEIPLVLLRVAMFEIVYFMTKRGS